MPQKILGIDIGAWSVKGVILEDRFRGFKLLRAHEVRIPDGPPEELHDRQVEAVRTLLEQEPEKVETVLAALPAQRTSVRFIDLPYSEAKKVDLTIGGELADILPFDIDDGVYSHEMITKMEDGGSLSIAAAARSTDIETLLDVFQDAGIDPKLLGVDSVDLFNLYSHVLQEDASTPEPPGSSTAPPPPANDVSVSEARLIVDIGHRRTLVSGAAGHLIFAESLRTGGADLDRAIATAFDLAGPEAEQLKHAQGFVASRKHPAPDESSQQVSDALKRGLEPLLRGLTIAIHAIRADRKLRVTRIDLLGGGSRIRNLANYIAEELQVPTAIGVAVDQVLEDHVDNTRRSAFACALAHSLRSVRDKPTSSLNLRKGMFAFSGQLQHLRTRLPAMVLSMAAIFVLLVVNVWSSFYTTNKRVDAIEEQFCAITQEVIGKEICDPTMALASMREPGGAEAVALPDTSALNIAAALSSRIPAELETITIESMQITRDRASITGEADSFDSVEKIKSAYSKDPCFTNVKNGKKMQRVPGSDRVEFGVSMKLECTS